MIIEITGSIDTGGKTEAEVNKLFINFLKNNELHFAGYTETADIKRTQL